MEVNPQNEKLKRRYFRWLKEAEGFSEPTIRTMERAICVFEDFSGHADLRLFGEKQAVGFKRWLDRRRSRGKPISTSTKYHYLRHLHAFFKWLATQPGYKSRINLDSVSYLSLDKKSVREALSPRPRRFPSLEYVLKLTGSITIKNEIDRRDRALIAILLLSGIRYTAICTLSLACFNDNGLTVHQDPKLGVRTKAGKVITTRLFRFSDTLVDYVTGWAEYLRDVKRFSPTDPLFPRNKVEQANGGFTFVCQGVEPAFWAGGNSIREILRQRALEADLPYYNPHAFRHAAVHLASQLCVTPEQFKAVSQNLGHEHVATTLKTYGTLDDSRLAQVLTEIELNPNKQDPAGGIPVDELEKILQKYQKKG